MLSVFYIHSEPVYMLTLPAFGCGHHVKELLKTNIMEQKFCQSCAMPMNDAASMGTNADQRKNEEYCCYCYKDGAFTADCSMDEMIEHCAQYVEEFNKDSEQKLTREEAITQMKMYFPQLKRWKQ